MKKKRDTFTAPASIVRRTIAFIIDIMILNFIVFIPFNSIFKKIIPATTLSSQAEYLKQNPHIIKALTPLMILIGLIILIYFSLLEYKTHQTPGKMLLRLRIVPERKLTFWNFVGSNLIFLLIRLIPIIWIIDIFHLIASPKSQRLLEKLNGIIVVQEYKYK